MKNRWRIDKDKVILYSALILIVAVNILWPVYKIGTIVWKNQVEEPNTAEDYASDEESKYIENARDKYIFTGRIDAWPNRIYCFENNENGKAYRYETKELLPIRMEIGDLVKITGEITWGEGECAVLDYVIKRIDSIKFVNEEVYIASIPEIKRVDKDYILQPITRKVEDPYGNGSGPESWPYDFIYYYYEETGEVIAYFKNFISIDENKVSGYYFVKRDGKVYKYEHSRCITIDGKEEWHYYNGNIPEEEMDKVFKRQRNEDIFFEYVIDPEVMKEEG